MFCHHLNTAVLFLYFPPPAAPVLTGKNFLLWHGTKEAAATSDLFPLSLRCSCCCNAQSCPHPGLRQKAEWGDVVEEGGLRTQALSSLSSILSIALGKALGVLCALSLAERLFPPCPDRCIAKLKSCLRLPEHLLSSPGQSVSGRAAGPGQCHRSGDTERGPGRARGTAGSW